MNDGWEAGNGDIIFAWHALWMGRDTSSGFLLHLAWPGWNLIWPDNGSLQSVCMHGLCCGPRTLTNVLGATTKPMLLWPVTHTEGGADDRLPSPCLYDQVNHRPLPPSGTCLHLFQLIRRFVDLYSIIIPLLHFLSKLFYFPFWLLHIVSLHK